MDRLPLHYRALDDERISRNLRTSAVLARRRPLRLLKHTRYRVHALRRTCVHFAHHQQGQRRYHRNKQTHVWFHGCDHTPNRTLRAIGCYTEPIPFDWAA